MNRKKILFGGLLSSLIGAALLLSLHLMFRQHRTHGAGFDTLSIRPWQNIGGCGAGGSGGGSSGVRWIGRGVSGALLDVEFMPKINFGQTFLNGMAEPRLGYHPRWSTELGLSMPIGMKEMEVQYQSNLDQQLVRNGSRTRVSGLAPASRENAVVELPASLCLTVAPRVPPRCRVESVNSAVVK